jgi:tetratricopeptide (TPR) repeat protein
LNTQPNDLLQRARDAVDRKAWQEAIRCYQLLMEQSPRDAESRYELAWLYRAMGRSIQALHYYDQALALGISRPEEVHLNRAVIYSEDLHRYPEAQSALELALKINPVYAEALLNLGNLHEDLGHKASALKCYERLARLDKKSPALTQLAWARLIQLEGSDTPAASVRRALEAAEQMPIEDTVIRATLWFALAHYQQAQGRFEEAFAWFEKANQLNAIAAPAYKPAAHELRVTHIVQDLQSLGTKSKQKEDDAAAMAGVSNSAKPLFVLGMFRSGSTLLEQVLNAHPHIYALGELSFLPRLVAGTMPNFPRELTDLPEQVLRDWRTHYVSQLPDIAPGVKYHTDKRPDNFLYIGLIKRLFPEAKIIHTVRNPMDNALSIFQHQLDPRVAAYSSTLAGIAHYYGQYQRLLSVANEMFPGDIFTLEYDQFVQTPEPILQRLLGFLGLPWDGNCLSFYTQKSAVKTASVWQVRQPIHTSSQGRWRCYENQLRQLVDAFRAQGIQLSD